jgi:hypothetical protein
MGAADVLNEWGLYGAYDLAIHNFLKDIVTKVEPTTVVIQSSPQRAFGDAAAMFAKGLDPDVLASMSSEELNRSALVPLPLVSVLPSAPEQRISQRMFPAKNLFRKFLPGTDESLRERYVAKPPLPKWITYQVEVWTKTRSMMDALITAIQQRFDGSDAAWGEAMIDDWFWGNVWMPVRLASITDNSELEAGDKDRVLRHTLQFRVEAWCFYPPEKDFTALKAIADVGVSQYQNLLVVPQTRFRSLYFVTPAKQIYQVCMTNGGQISIIPTNEPPNPITCYFDEGGGPPKDLLFTDGLVLDENRPNGQVWKWLVTYQATPKVGRTGTLSKLNVVKNNSSLPKTPSLFIPLNQNLLIGDGSGYFYTELHLPSARGLSQRSRYFTNNNVPPTKVSLPYATLLPQ